MSKIRSNKNNIPKIDFNSSKKAKKINFDDEDYQEIDYDSLEKKVEDENNKEDDESDDAVEEVSSSNKRKQKDSKKNNKKNKKSKQISDDEDDEPVEEVSNNYYPEEEFGDEPVEESSALDEFTQLREAMKISSRNALLARREKKLKSRQNYLQSILRQEQLMKEQEEANEKLPQDILDKEAESDEDDEEEDEEEDEESDYEYKQVQESQGKLKIISNEKIPKNKRTINRTLDVSVLSSAPRLHLLLEKKSFSESQGNEVLKRLGGGGRHERISLNTFSSLKQNKPSKNFTFNKKI